MAEAPAPEDCGPGRMRISDWGFPIIDFHAHFPVPDEHPPAADERYRQRHGERKAAILKKNWRWYQEQWWSAYSFPFPEEDEPAPEVQARRWSDEIEAAQLEAVVFVTGGGNRLLAEAIAHQPRMLGFAHHDPFLPGAADELRRSVVEAWAVRVQGAGPRSRRSPRRRVALRGLAGRRRPGYSGADPLRHPRRRRRHRRPRQHRSPRPSPGGQGLPRGPIRGSPLRLQLPRPAAAVGLGLPEHPRRLVGQQ